MARVLEQDRGLRELDDLAEVHDGDALAHRAHHREVVRDEQVRERERVLQAAEELQHTRLNGHVEPRGRLVEDDEARPHHQRAREAHAPLLSAGQLVRIEVEMRVGQADRLQHRLDLALALRPRQRRVDLERLVEQPPDLPARVERCAGILVHVL
jgi:hypothetical protein